MCRAKRQICDLGIVVVPKHKPICSLSLSYNGGWMAMDLQPNPPSLSFSYPSTSITRRAIHREKLLACDSLFWTYTNPLASCQVQSPLPSVAFQLQKHVPIIHQSGAEPIFLSQEIKLPSSICLKAKNIYRSELNSWWRSHLVFIVYICEIWTLVSF